MAWLESRDVIVRNGSRVRLLLALDANSAAKFERKNVEKGAANQALFTKHLADDPCLQTCWHHSNAAPDHTVRKERTYLQCQWKKTGNLDMSVKDYIISSAQDVTMRALAINRFGNLQFSPLAEPQWDPNDYVFSADDFMPSPLFPSDHALVLAEIHYLLPERKTTTLKTVSLLL